MKKLFTIIIVFLFAIPGIGQASLVSGFDSSIEGWATVGATAPAFSANGGNPGGYIYATDNSGSPTFENFGWGFISPDGWDGNWIAYANGTVEFDLMPVGHNGAGWGGTIVGIFSGSNYMYTFQDNALADGIWSNFDINLTDENFTEVGATFSQILQNVTALYIMGDLNNGTETTALDNVRVNAVPIPAAAWLLGAGLAGLAGIRVRRKTLT
jgi:hypothetical protein